MKKLITSLLTVCIMTATTFAATITVPVDYSTIQAAVNASSAGDTVIVSPGTYVENITMPARDITLRSTDPYEPNTVAATIINGNGSGSVLTCDAGQTSATLISGFTVTNGNGPLLSGGGGGININNSEPTIENCVFSNNTGYNGGAIRNYGNMMGITHLAITNCTFTGNTGDEYDEYTGLGGGIYNQYSEITMTGCIFSGNSTGGSGGAIHSQWADLILDDCTFSGNTAYDGGGIYNDGCSAIVDNCVFSGNLASNDGSAMYNNSCTPTVSNSYFCDNVPDPPIYGPYTDGGNNNMSSCVPEPIPGDINGDGRVDMLDLAILSANWLVGVE